MIWKCRSKTIDVSGRPLIMGILNVTPDSFSDGGLHLDAAAAVSRGLQMVEEGADIIDVGGESTRPGADEVPESVELSRVVPVISELRASTEALISIDTTKAEVARQAVEAGADIINDVSALTLDPDMPAAAVETGAGLCLMHMLGNPRTMQENPSYENVVTDVADELEKRANELIEKGVSPEAITLDPGIGFGKTLEHNLQLLEGLEILINKGFPVIVGLSRKSFLGKITGSPVDGRLAGSLAGLAFCVMKGVHVMRVHDVKESVEAVRLLQRLKVQGFRG